MHLTTTGTGRLLSLTLALGMAVGSNSVQAADTNVIVLEPVHYTFVDGNSTKFQAHHWTKRSYRGGIEEFSADRTFENGISVTAEGHALIDQNDIGASLSLLKEVAWFLNMHFSEFRKYYDRLGGTFNRFINLGSNSTDKDLRLDIGKFELEAGLKREGWNEIVFLYEREFKRGAKSRLTWMSTTDTTFSLGAGIMRKTAPSWQEIDEVVDAFTLRLGREIAGFDMKAEQKWEFVNAENTREEKSLTTTAVAADGKIRRQNQHPATRLMTTFLHGERWLMNDKLFIASGYRFGHMDNREFEQLGEFSASGAPASYSYPEQKPSSRADNDYDTHTWVENFSIKPFGWLTVVGKVKAEVIKRESNSSYPQDSTNPPDGIINSTEESITDNKATRWGESLSFRFSGVPKTALYTELEMEQSRVLMREDRKSRAGQSGASANDIFSRETVTQIARGAVTLGGRTSFTSYLDVTNHLRHRWNNTDYDDQRETAAGSSTSRSAFFDGQSVETNELASRVMFKPCRWFSPSLRYQLRDDKYATRAENEPIVKTGMLSNIYTIDLTLRPKEEISTTLAYSKQQAATYTPARLANSAANIPTFHSDSDNWLLTTEYLPKSNLTVTNTVSYILAENFDDFSNRGIPYGVDNERLDVGMIVTWLMKENSTLKTEYDYSHFQPHSKSEAGGYQAHSIWLEVSNKF
jgi:hypothetical protein